MTPQKDKVFTYCLVVLLPFLIGGFAIWLIEYSPKEPRDEWMETFMQFFFVCLMCSIFIWRGFNRYGGQRVLRLVAVILGGLSLLLVVWFVQTFGTIPLDRWLHTLVLAVGMLAICAVAIWHDMTKSRGVIGGLESARRKPS